MAGSDDCKALATAVLDACKARGLQLATAESCTGGMVTVALTDIPGSSAVLDRGFVTYSNAAKTEMLGVPAGLLALHGAVSEPVALAMARGARSQSRARLAVAITGIAGPGGISARKPEGLVHFAVSGGGKPDRHERIEFGAVGRSEVRRLSVIQALKMLLEQLSEE